MFDWIKLHMGNLMSCVLICGAVEVVHVVHSDGHVERLIRPLDHSTHKAVKGVPPSSSLPQADLMRCLSSLGRATAAGSEGEGYSGGHYLLLPIRNADDPSVASGGVFKYKRLSSFQFYKSAFLSTSLKPKNSCSSTSSSSASTSPSKSLVPSKVKVSPKESSSGANNVNVKANVTTNNKRSHSHSHNHSSDDVKKQLLKESQPFKVKQEGGVTKLVVSKRYLAQLLSESNMKKTSGTTSSTSTSNDKQYHHHSKQQDESNGGGGGGGGGGIKTSLQSSSASSTPRVGRPGIWRPALESISEGNNFNNSNNNNMVTIATR